MDKDRVPHVLVVDDEFFIRDAIKLYLESNGFRVSTAEGRTEALRVFNNRDDPVDVAILDLVMPGTNGIDLLKKFKSIDPAVETIIATGCGSMNSAVEALRHGAFDYITKPFVDFDEDLLKSLEKALAARRGNVESSSAGSDSAASDENEVAGRLSLYERLNRFVATSAGKPRDEDTWAAIWNLVHGGFGAEAALLVDQGQGGAWTPVKSWGFNVQHPLAEQEPAATPWPATRSSPPTSSKSPSKGPRASRRWSEILHLPIYQSGDPQEKLLLLLFYGKEGSNVLEEPPHALLSAALGAVLGSGARSPEIPPPGAQENGAQRESGLIVKYEGS
jgi:DNA-binding response OmpR family regulator